MAIAAVASVTTTTGATPTGTTAGVDTTGASLIEVSVMFNAGAGPVVSDSENNSWFALTPQTPTNITTQKFYAYCSGAGKTGASHTFTVTFATTAYAPIMVRAYSGTNIRFDSENGATNAATTSLNSGSVTPSANNALVTSAIGWGGVNVVTSLAVSGGSLAIIAQIASISSVIYGGAYADEIQTTATARNPAWTWTGSVEVSGVTATYYEGATAPTASPRRALEIEAFDGFGGSNAQLAKKWGTTGTILWAAHPKTGTYGVGNDAGVDIHRIMPVTGSRVIVNLWFYWDGINIPSYNGTLWMFLNSGGSYTGFNAVTSLIVNSGGTLSVAAGANGVTPLATSAACLNVGLNYIQTYYDVQNAGTYVVLCNSSQVLSGSGDICAGTSPGVLAGFVMGINGGIGNDSLTIYDTVTAADLFSTEVTVSMFRPTLGNGAHTGLTPSTGTDHGALVREAVANDDTDYNSGAAGVADTYVFNLSALAGTPIYGIALTIVAKATSGGTNTIAGIARVGGVDYAGATQAITTSYAYYHQNWTNDPSTLAAWVGASALEFGVSSIASVAANRITAVYLDVAHEPFAGQSFRRTLHAHGTLTGRRQNHW